MVYKDSEIVRRARKILAGKRIYKSLEDYLLHSDIIKEIWHNEALLGCPKVIRCYYEDGRLNIFISDWRGEGRVVLFGYMEDRKGSFCSKVTYYTEDKKKKEIDKKLTTVTYEAWHFLRAIW